MSEKLLKKYYAAVSGVYDVETKKRGWIPNKKSDKLLLPVLKKGYRVLDLGIGTGQSSNRLLKRGCKMVGIDISEEMLAIAHKKYPAIKLYKANIEKGLSLVQDDTFDAVVAIGVFEFIGNLPKVLRQILKVTKPQGYFCFTYEEYLPKSRLQKWKVAELGRGLVDPVPKPMSFPVYRYTSPEIKKLLKDAEFKVLHNHSFVAYVKTNKNIPVYYSIVLAQKI